MSLFGALHERAGKEAQEAVHGAEAADGLSMEGLPDFISHHIGDAKDIEFAGGQWSLESLSIDPIHLGIMIVLNMEIGLVTPPVGLNLFVTSSVAKMPMEEVISAALPWLMVLLSVLIIVTYIPGVSLIVPTLLGVL